MSEIIILNTAPCMIHEAGLHINQGDGRERSSVADRCAQAGEREDEIWTSGAKIRGMVQIRETATVPKQSEPV